MPSVGMEINEHDQRINGASMICDASHWKLPNIITYLRILLAPVIVWMVLDEHLRLALFFLVLSGVSDWLDGFIARYFNQCSTLGVYLDPIADKIMMGSVYISFAIQGYLPVWLAILVVVRDLLIIGAVFLSQIMNWQPLVTPVLLGKASTVFQILLPAVCLFSILNDLWINAVIVALITIVVVLTIWSGVLYLMRWFCLMKHGSKLPL